MLLGIPARDGVIVTLMEEKPRVAIGLAAVLVPAAGVDQREPTAQLLAEELELELAGCQRGRRIIGLLRLIRAPIPDDGIPCAVLATRDDALELQVLDGMVLGARGKPAGGRIEGGTLWNGPASEHPVHLQPEVVVQSSGSVAPHHEAPGTLADQPRLRLRRLPEVAFLPIGLERHARMVSLPGGHGSCASRCGGRKTGGRLA